MSSLTKALAGVRDFLNRMNIKAPWKYTGINSSFEYQDYRISAETYRTPSPASSKQKCLVPDADPEHVLDIGYYNRQDVGSEANRNAGIVTQKKLEGLPFMKVYGTMKKVPLTDDGEDGGYAR